MAQDALKRLRLKVVALGAEEGDLEVPEGMEGSRVAEPQRVPEALLGYLEVPLHPARRGSPRRHRQYSLLKCSVNVF